VRGMNMKVFVGLAVAGLALFILVPSVGRSLGPLLIAAACPLSMLGMMVAMGKGSANTKPDPTTQPVAHAPADRDTELADLRARLAHLEGQRDANVPHG
jgi:hypothetical protein